MDSPAQALELRHLRCLVAIADTGTFTDAAIELGISQAAVSRNLMALEKILGVRVLHRTSRQVSPTTAGTEVLVHARQVLAAADNLVTSAASGHSRLRIGHAWSAMGRHTQAFQRRWAASHPDVELQLVRANSPTGGLAEGLCDIAVVRSATSSRDIASAVVGHERRYCAMSADDPWVRRRSIRLSEITQRVLLIDSRTGTTTPDLWPPGTRPRMRETHEIDDWLAVIAAGGGVGITAEGTTSQYRRDGVVFRPLRDAPPITVTMIWHRHDPHPATSTAVTLLTELYAVLRIRGSRAAWPDGPTPARAWTGHSPRRAARYAYGPASRTLSVKKSRPSMSFSITAVLIDYDREYRSPYRKAALPKLSRAGQPDAPCDGDCAVAVAG